MNEACHLVRVSRARFPAVHPVGCDFEALALFERELYGEVGVGSAMHDQVIGWDGKLPVDDDHFMSERNAGLPWNWDSAAGTDAHLSVDVPDGVGDETIPRVCTTSSAGGSDGNCDHNLASRFDRLGSAVSPEVIAPVN